ncbi:hypothetical protein CAMRE0001_2543 [Campylobacter rectus RM3267]|uniref:Uncharacterized protein n=1 Tax=Campylobacter rectus RM3267 TaxID=553218 RepID=B9D3S8_CAMRE|nr:hypothetical protein CAMRE0001_2543 [Campylobacter rectus RM3267]
MPRKFPKPPQNFIGEFKIAISFAKCSEPSQPHKYREAIKFYILKTSCQMKTSSRICG